MPNRDVRRPSRFIAAVFCLIAVVLCVVGVHAATDFATGTAYYIPAAAIYKASPSTLADGDVDALHTDASHNLLVTVQNSGTSSSKVQGAAADGATASGNPVQVGGVDGSSNVQAILVDTSGRTAVVGAAAQGATIAGNPVLLGGTFTTTPATITTGQAATLQTDAVQSLLIAGNGPVAAGAAGTKSLLGGLVYNSTLPSPTTGQQVALQGGPKGELIVGGQSAAAAAVAGNPVLIGASDGTNARNLLCDQNGLFQIAPPSGGGVTTWALTHTPTTGTQATASQAAGAAGVKHVCTSISFGHWQNGTGAASATAGLTINLRDGATGAGTIKWSGVISFPATAFGQSYPITVSGLNIVGTAATAMTIESAAAPAANSAVWVAASGFDTK